MTAFLIADTFTDSLARLNGDEQKAVKTTAFDLQMNTASPGLSFHKLDKGRWCADAGRPTRFKPSSPSPTDAARDGSAKLGHPVQNVTREHGLTPLPR